MPDFEATILCIAHLREESTIEAEAALAAACALPADSAVLSALVGVGRADLVARYLAAMKGAPGVEKLGARPRNLRLDHLVQMAAQSGNVDMMEALHSGDFPIDPIADLVFQAACRGGHAKLISWVEETLWAGNIPDQSLSTAITDCGRSVSKKAAPELANILTRRVRENRIEPDFLHRALHETSPKILAALLIAGVRPEVISRTLEIWAQDRPETSVRRDCLHLARSNHGRMHLMALEPSLEALIARSPLKTFLGLGPQS